MSDNSTAKLDNVDPSIGGERPIQVRILAHIPKQYQNDPIISHITASYGVKVNILAATLGIDVSANGWFDLQLIGSAQAVDDALLYLVDQNIGVFRKDGQEVDGW